MKQYRFFLLVLAVFLLFPVGAFAQEASFSEPGSESSYIQNDENLSSFLDEVSQFHEDTENSLSAMESSDSSDIPSSAPSESSLSPDDIYLKEFKEYRQETALTLQFILGFLCFACGVLICVCVVRFIHHD